MASSRAPGRVNLIGEHTDYNQGLVLPIALEQATRVRFRRRPDDRVLLRSRLLDAEGGFRLGDLGPGSVSGWLAYPAGVAWALGEEGVALTGLQGEIEGDLPLGAGLSSSAALEVAVGLALVHAAGAQLELRELALACHRAENEFVGVRSGIMDQFASALARAGTALFLDCRSLEVRHIPVPPDFRLVVAHTGVERTLGEAYNRRREACEAAARELGLPSLREARPEDLGRLEGVLARRARHVVEENARVRAAVEALSGDDLEELGRLMDASHESLRDLFQVSSPELEAMVEACRTHPGCLGARLTGAGFGGSAIALVRPEALADFLAHLPPAYEERAVRRGRFWVTTAAGGAGLETEDL